MIDITGKKYNRLTAITYLGKSNWRCVCDCGRIAIVPSYAIINGRIKSCGCIRRETAKNLNLKKWGELAFTNIYCSYRVSAKTRGVTFGLSEDEFKRYNCQAVPLLRSFT